MNWFVLAIFHAFGNSFANILRKTLMKNDKNDPVASAILFQLQGTAIVTIFALVNGFTMPPVQAYPMNFLLQGVLWGLATICLFQAYKFIEASEVTIIVSLEAVVTIIAAVVLLKEVFIFTYFIGAALVIASIFYISYASKKFAFNKGVIYALLYSLFAGVAVVNDTYMLGYSEVLSYLVIGWFTPAIVIALLNPLAVKKLISLFNPRIFYNHFIFTFIYVLSGLGFFFALANGGQASQVGTISQASVVLTVLLATIFLKERDHLLKKAVCAVLVTIGVLLLR
jgi:uncharacterized membrane protein